MLCTGRMYKGGSGAAVQSIIVEGVAKWIV